MSETPDDDARESNANDANQARGDGIESVLSGLSVAEAHALGQATGRNIRMQGNYTASGVTSDAIRSRKSLSRTVGQGDQFGGKRNLYDTLGYDDDPDFDAYFKRYIRQDIAKRIVDAPAKKTWQEWPDIEDDDDAEEETAFEKDVQELVDDSHALESLRNVDRYAGIGYVGALVIGFADGGKLKEPVEPNALPDSVDEAIAYLTPCHEGAIQQITLNDDDSSDRFGEPETIEIDFSEMDSLDDSGVNVTNKKMQRTVHHSRVILVQPDRPRLEPVYNRLMDLEKVTGASAELFWRGADYGLALNLDGDAAAAMGDQQRRELQNDIEKEAEAYYHGLQPFLKTAGVDVERLGGEDVDPTGIAELLLKLIAGTIQMPKRILTGSERGELASTQDRASWLGHIANRQDSWAEPHILRPFIDKLVEFAILSPPQGDRYDVEWPNLFELNEVEQAEVMSKKATAFKTAADGMMAANIATEGEVRQEILDWGIEIGSETGEAERGEVPEFPERGRVPPEQEPPGGDGDDDIPDDLSDIEDDDDIAEQFRQTRT